MAMERPTATSSQRLGKYELIKELAGSGVASTWIGRAMDGTPGLFSVARLHRHVTKKVEVAESFLAEAKKALPLRHPNITRLWDVGINDGEVFTVTEHLEGESLANLLTTAGSAGFPQ